MEKGSKYIYYSMKNQRQNGHSVVVVSDPENTIRVRFLTGEALGLFVNCSFEELFTGPEFLARQKELLAMRVGFDKNIQVVGGSN